MELREAEVPGQYRRTAEKMDETIVLWEGTWIFPPEISVFPPRHDKLVSIRHNFLIEMTNL